jgi:hypothetical protein
MGTDVTLVFSEPGWWFAHADFPDLRGAHGGPRTRSTVAVVAGPEPALEMLRSRFLAPTFGAEHWYGVIQTARGVDWKAT